MKPFLLKTSTHHASRNRSLLHVRKWTAGLAISQGRHSFGLQFRDAENSLWPQQWFASPISLAGISLLGSDLPSENVQAIS